MPARRKFNRAAAAHTVTLLALCLSWALGGCMPVQKPLARTLADVVDTPGAPLASLAVLALRGDEVVFEGYWGNRRIEPDPAHTLPVTADTKFRVASISKVVTAIGVMQLVEQGKLDLDRDVSDYLGFRLRNPSFPTQPITARMLLSHTSSLRDGSIYAIPLPYTLRDFFLPDGAYYAGGEHFAWPINGLDLRPGHYFTYANLNFGVLGTLIEAISGQRFDRYMASHVLAPLAIQGGYNVAEFSRPWLSQLAALYRKQDPQGQWDPGGPWYAQVDDYQGAPPINIEPQFPDGVHQFQKAVEQPVADAGEPDLLATYKPGSNGTLFGPQGGLRISARDLAKIAQVFIQDGRYGAHQILRPATVQQMLSEQWRYNPAKSNGDTYAGLMRAWGLGLQHTTATSEQGQGDSMAPGSQDTFWGQAGDAYGLLSGMWFDPAREVAFIYIIGGVGDDPERHRGAYSSNYRWEEEIQAALVQKLDAVAPPPTIDIEAVHKHRTE